MRFGRISVEGRDQWVVSPTGGSFYPTKTLDAATVKNEIPKSFLDKKTVELNRDRGFSPESLHFKLSHRPPLFRDFYCFEEHVKNGRKSRGLEMIPEFYEAPVFYYSNPFSFIGPEEDLEYPEGVSELDFELEVACLIGKELRNASLEQAKEAIAGYSVLNDWSARDLQRFEMKLNMGPTKGKDFATSLGSFWITPDEIESKRKNKGYDIEFSLLWNGNLVTKKNWSTIQFSFEEMLVRASKNCTLYPGEILGSGTMGFGSLLEWNAEKQGERSLVFARDDKGARWVQKGDVVELKWGEDGPTTRTKVV